MADMKFKCPECKQSLQVDEDAGGQKITCPSCSKPIGIPFAAPTQADDDGEGLLGFLEQILKKMIWGVFRFIFFDSPQKIWRFFVQSFPWLVRMLRVLFYGCAWALLSFWPFVLTKYVVHLNYLILNDTKSFILKHGNQINALGYVWAAISLAGSVWGIAKWASLHKAQKAKIKAQGS